MPLVSINPATGELLRQFEALTDEALEGRMAAASEAKKPLRAAPVTHRALWLRKLATLFETEAAELALTVTQEMGKPLEEARSEALKCAKACRFYAEHGGRMIAPEPILQGPVQGYVQWEPMGVVLAVMPWNFPLWQVMRWAAPALMAGNVCLLKPAPNVCGTGLLLEALVRRAGFPRGSFQTLLLETHDVERVLGDARVAAVTLTGSETAGRAIAAQAGWSLKKSVLELGGSDAFLVRPSAEMDRTVRAAVESRCVNGGQSCIAAKRFVVATEVYDEFVTQFVAGMRDRVLGDPMLEATQIGPMATRRQMETLEGQVKTAVAAGARVLTGGSRVPGDGFFFQPTVLEGVPRSCPVYREELFGPVAMVFRAETLEEAIVLANETPFGLGASAWTRDPAEQHQLLNELECGMVFLNQMVASDPRLPFGGVKRSGYGRELSAIGMHEFMNAKTVVVAAPPVMRGSADRGKSAPPGGIYH